MKDSPYVANLPLRFFRKSGLDKSLIYTGAFGWAIFFFTLAGFDPPADDKWFSITWYARLLRVQFVEYWDTNMERDRT
jgi:hypothetical protein